MRWKHLPIVAFDTETTGLQPFDGDRIIEFGAVELTIGEDGRVADVTRHSLLVNPQMAIPRKVTEITGIRDTDVAAAPLFAEIAPRVHELLSGSITVAHNFPFDLAFLTQQLEACELGWPEPIAEVDTVDLSIAHFADERRHRLEDLCRRLDVPLDNAHRAADDAEATGRCFIELARRHEVADELQAMLDWARAIGRPPADAALCPDDSGQIVFRDGPHAGQPVGDHPIHLAWMEKARVRGPNGWQWRYPDSIRDWARRWLDVRGSGRARQNPKSYRSTDWVLDSCIAVDRVS
jgi:DNA polymerase III epsilon subunit family exonuclease